MSADTLVNASHHSLSTVWLTVAYCLRSDSSYQLLVNILHPIQLSNIHHAQKDQFWQACLNFHGKFERKTQETVAVLQNKQIQRKLKPLYQSDEEKKTQGKGKLS